MRPGQWRAGRRLFAHVMYGLQCLFGRFVTDQTVKNSMCIGAPERAPMRRKQLFRCAAAWSRIGREACGFWSPFLLSSPGRAMRASPHRLGVLHVPLLIHATPLSLLSKTQLSIRNTIQVLVESRGEEQFSFSIRFFPGTGRRAPPSAAAINAGSVHFHSTRTQSITLCPSFHTNTARHSRSRNCIAGLFFFHLLRVNTAFAQFTRR